MNRSLESVAGQWLCRSELIILQASAQWVGRMESTVLFRDPVTGSTCALPEKGLTVAGVLRKLESKRLEFGGKL